MDRKEFLRMGCCAFALVATQNGVAAEVPKQACGEQELGDLKFIQGWVTDLMDTIDQEPDDATKIRLLSGCGRGCFRRSQFKQDLAAQGKGSLDKLLAAYKNVFEVWREGDDKVHLRSKAAYSGQCNCAAATFRPRKPRTDIQCYCTRASHQALWETALGYAPKIDILQSVRRGDPICHFLVHLA